MRPYYVLDFGDGPPTIAAIDDLSGAPAADRAQVARLEIGEAHRADGWTATRCRPGILWAAMGLDPGGDGATLAAVYLRLAVSVPDIRQRSR